MKGFYRPGFFGFLSEHGDSELTGVIPRHARASLAVPGRPSAAITVPGRPSATIRVPSRPSADVEV